MKSNSMRYFLNFHPSFQLRFFPFIFIGTYKLSQFSLGIFFCETSCEWVRRGAIVDTKDPCRLLRLLEANERLMAWWRLDSQKGILHCFSIQFAKGVDSLFFSTSLRFYNPFITLPISSIVCNEKNIIREIEASEKNGITKRNA